jgi:hypothetical protein
VEADLECVRRALKATNQAVMDLLQPIFMACQDQAFLLLDQMHTYKFNGTGRVVLTLAGDGAIAAQAECLDVTLRDVTRPYLAPSGKAPDRVGRQDRDS